MIILHIGNKQIKLDLLAAERDFVSIEGRTGVTGKSPTLPMLDALAVWLNELGAEDCSRSAAWQVWWAIYERIDHLRQRARSDAEIAFWFHVNPFALTEDQRVALLANLPRVKAQSTLHHGQYSGTDYEHVYHLTLLATGDQQAAERAKANAMDQFVDAKMGSQ